MVRCRTAFLLLFLNLGHPCFSNFYPTIQVDVVRVKSYVTKKGKGVCNNEDQSKAGGVRCCGRALIRWRSGYGRVGCPGHVP